jgi:hypothetical protein
MSEYLKYVVIDNAMGVEVPIIFSHLEQHDHFLGWHVISAGFVTIYPMDDFLFAGCFGESVSLKIKSRGIEDEKLITRMMNNDDIDSVKALLAHKEAQDNNLA